MHRALRPATARLHIVVVTFNSEEVIGDCLQSLADETRALDAEVVVVDNGSADSTCAVVASARPHVRILRSSGNLGYAGALNLALQEIPGNCAVVVSNADIRICPGTLTALLTASTSPSVGMVVPRIVDGAGKTQASLRRTPTAARAWSDALLGGSLGRGEVIAVDARYGTAHDCDWATGAFALITPAGRRAVPYWDESYFLYSEETEAMLRMGRMGLRIRYEPRAIVCHTGGQMEVDPRLWRLQVRNRIAWFRRHHGPARSMLFQSALVTNEAIRAPRNRVHRAGLMAALAPGRVPHPGPAGVVCFAAVDWWYHNRAHSDLALARRIARRRPVLIVNSLGLRVPRPGRSSQALRRIGRKVASLSHLLHRLDGESTLLAVLTTTAIPGVERLRGLSAALVAAQVRAAAAWYLMGTPHLLITIPTAVDVIDRLPHARVVVNRSDLHSAFPEVDTALIESMESELLRRADVVLYVSHALMERDRVGAKGVFLDHGVDLELFTADEAEEPEDIRTIPRPRIGFFGGLDDYVVDLDLIARLAKETADASVVLIGDATCSLDSLTSAPNVHLLGRRDHAAIPAYGRAFDVAIMPWLDNDWIRNCNPIKLKEYLALDLPVVSTPYPELTPYLDLVRVGASADEFIARVQETLREPSRLRGAGPTRVASDDWQVKADLVLALMEQC